MAEDQIFIEHEQPKMLCIGETDMRQNDRLNAIETHLKIMETSKGTLKLGDIAKLGSIMGFLFALMTAISSMWIAGKTEATRTKQTSILQTQSYTSEALSRLEGEIDGLKEELGELSEELSATLDPEVLEQRFASLKQSIEDLEGRFGRITSERLQPLIEKNIASIDKLEDARIDELKRQRDQSN